MNNPDTPEQDNLEELVATKSVEKRDYEDSFYSYLHDLRHYEPMDSESRENLIFDIATTTFEYQQVLALFATTSAEFLRYVQDSVSNNLNLEDFFLGSSIAEVVTGDSKEFRKEWLKELRLKFDNYKNSFNNNSSDQKAKQKILIDAICKLKMPSDILEDFYNIICDYVLMWDSDLKNANSMTLEKNINLTNYTQTQMTFLSNKFMIPVDEISKTLKELYLCREKLIHYKHIFLESHLRLVINLAQKFKNRGLPFSDVIQEGNLGLMRAIDKFDVKLGHRFSTYAVWWIKQNIVRGIAEQARTIRIPTHMLNTINQINRAEQKLLQDFGREPESYEIAEFLELSVAKVNAIRRMARQALSLQAPVGGENETTSLGDMLEAENSVDPIDSYSQENTYNKLYEMLKMLSEREQQIIMLRFGLFGHQVTPLSEVSEKFGLTRERIRQLELKILCKMRSPKSMELLDCGKK